MINVDSGPVRFPSEATHNSVKRLIDIFLRQCPAAESRGKFFSEIITLHQCWQADHSNITGEIVEKLTSFYTKESPFVRDPGFVESPEPAVGDLPPVDPGGGTPSIEPLPTPQRRIGDA